MTISPHRVESVLRAYNKQTNSKESISESIDGSNKYQDTVTLSSGHNRESAYETISYGLLDILLQNKQAR